MPRKKLTSEPGTRKYGVRSNYSPEKLEECLEKVKSGELSAYSASKHFQIPINTIKNKLKNKHTEKVGRPTALTNEEEIIIKEHVKALADSGIPVALDDVSLIIQRYLNSVNRKIKVFSNNRPGWEWGQLFLSRHPDLKLRFGRNISRSRAQVDEAKINQFFDNLEVELQDIPPENIFNFDETGFHDDPQKKKMLFRRKCRNPEVIRNSTKSCYTTVFCGNAAGEMIPPYFIFKAKNTWSDWLIGAPPGSRMTVTKSGWIDIESFEDWFSTHFLPIALKKEGKKVLLCDNLSSHISVKTLKLCKDNDVKFICLVPNSTHILQPLDVGYFSALKSSWRSVLLNWRQTTRGKKAVALPKNCFATLVKRTLELNAHHSSSNIIAGFRAAGIYPLNRQEALNRLAEYAKTPINVTDVKEALGESFKSYLSEIRTADLGIQNQRKFQMPVSAGKSVSVEEVEAYYRNKNEANVTKPKVSTKRGRPQGSKNKKKLKTQHNENKKDEVDITLAPSTSNLLDEMPPESEEIETDMAEEEVIEEMIEEFVVIDGVLQHEQEEESMLLSKPSTSKYVEFSPGTTVIFKTEGSLFPGKVISSTFPYYTLVVMSKSIQGGWKWPDKREIIKIKYDDVVSTVDNSKISIKQPGLYTINDDLLYMEWGE